MSKIYIPVDRIETLVEYRLVKEFIEFWTVNRPIPTNLDELLEAENGYYRKVGINNRRGNFTRKTIIEVALEEIERQSKRELQAQISGAAAELANQLADYIGRGVKEVNAQGEEITVDRGLIKQLTDYHKALKEKLLGRLNERIRAFNKIETSPIYQELSQGVEEIDLFYVDQNNRPIGENTLTGWERRFFENSAGIENLWEMRHNLERGENKLLEILLAFSNDTMRHIKDKQVDTIERLTQTHRADSAQYHAMVARLLNYAQPWLPEASHFVDTALTNREYAHWIARYDSVSETHESFNQKVKQLDQDYKNVDSSPDRIYAAAEVAGFPLMVINDLDNYRNDAYLPYLEKNEVLHTDLAFEKFQDLLIKRPEEIQSYIDTLGTFLRATLLGIINADQSNADEPGSLMEYSYIDKSQIFPETIDLGAFSVAISRLSRSREQDLLRRIQSDVVNAINDMNNDNLQKWTALLSFHAGGGEKASYYSRFPRKHVVRAIFLQEAQSLITQNGDRMKNAAQTEMENLKRWALERPAGQQIWAVERPQDSGLFILESWRR